MGLFQELNDQGITLIMVTHELDIARYTRRNIVMRDGRVISDVLVTERLHAAEQSQRLRDEQRAVQLAP